MNFLSVNYPITITSWCATLNGVVQLVHSGFHMSCDADSNVTIIYRAILNVCSYQSTDTTDAESTVSKNFN